VLFQPPRNGWHSDSEMKTQKKTAKEPESETESETIKKLNAETINKK
jgi:hypothetical protein